MIKNRLFNKTYRAIIRTNNKVKNSSQNRAKTRTSLENRANIQKAIDKEKKNY